MKKLCLPLFFIAATAWAPSVWAEPAPAPDLMITFDGTLVTNSSSNSGPAVKQIIEDTYDPGACSDVDDWASCDSLRPGMAVHAGPMCTDGDPLVVFYDPGEDVAPDIRTKLNGISSSTEFCSGPLRNTDSAMSAVWDYTFPGGTSSSDDQLDEYWERPNLQLLFTDGLPQNADGSNGNRVKQTLGNLCVMHEGPAGLPSMPTWVYVERKDDDPEILFGGLAAAAGGTGACEYDDPSNGWTPINVCDHIQLPGVNENVLRNRIDNARYRCQGGTEVFRIGQMDNSSSNGQPGVPYIRCHLEGNCNGNKPDTNLFGILACVRQLPRGLSYGDVTIRYCDENDNCVELREEDGDIEFIDEKKTLFVVTNLDNCEAGGITITTCEEGLPCETGLDGRCAFGETACPNGVEVCVPFAEYPEICNGLDDDCDGRVDNMNDSWAKPLFSSFALPDDHAGVECNLLDVCVCPDGATDTHAGSTFDEYLDEWDPICYCGEALEPANQSVGEPATIDAPASDSDAACSTLSVDNETQSWPLALLGVLALGAAFLRRR